MDGLLSREAGDADPDTYCANGSCIWNQWNIAGCYGGTPFAYSGLPDRLDGSLWTLTHEFKCYADRPVGIGESSPARASCSALRPAATFLLSCCVDVLANVSCRSCAISSSPDSPFVFLLGSDCALYEERIEIRRPFGIMLRPSS